jgi:hypothetical protein
MTEADNIDRIITALRKVPEKKLLIIELANTIPIVNGELDYAELANRQLDINLAIAEAKVYGTHTLQAVDALVRLRAAREA